MIINKVLSFQNYPTLVFSVQPSDDCRVYSIYLTFRHILFYFLIFLPFSFVCYGDSSFPQSQFVSKYYE